MADVDGSVLLVSSDFPSVTYPSRSRRSEGHPGRTVDDRAEENLTESLIDAIDDSAEVMFQRRAVRDWHRRRRRSGRDHAHRGRARVVVDPPSSPAPDR